MSSVELRKRPKAQVEVRLLGTVDADDYVKLTKREPYEDWVFLCEELADRNFHYAEEQLALGRRGTARYFFSQANALYMLSQYGLTDLTEEKLGLYRKLMAASGQFAALGPNLFEPVQIPYKDYQMDGWLVTPRNMKPDMPIVLMIPGATAFKDSFIRGMDGWLMSGVAVLLMDGPGQGSTRFFNNGMLEVNVENAYRKMIDFIKADGRFGKVGVYGGSTGGYYVARVAGTDKRVEFCISNGGCWDPEEILNYSEDYLHKFAVLSGISDEEMRVMFKDMTLDGIGEQIECPLLVQHGDADPIFSTANAKKIYDNAKSKDKTFIAYPDAWHCCAGEGSRAVRFMLDWITEHVT